MRVYVKGRHTEMEVSKDFMERMNQKKGSRKKDTIDERIFNAAQNM